MIGSNGTLYTNDGQSVALIGANVPFWIYKRGARCAGSAVEVTRSRTLGLSCNCRDKAPHSGGAAQGQMRGLHLFLEHWIAVKRLLKLPGMEPFASDPNTGVVEADESYVWGCSRLHDQF